MSLRITIPGTLTKVTPDSDAPSIPNATKGHGDSRLPRKNASLPPFPTNRETARTTMKYTISDMATVCIMMQN